MGKVGYGLIFISIKVKKVNIDKNLKILRCNLCLKRIPYG